MVAATLVSETSEPTTTAIEGMPTVDSIPVRVKLTPLINQLHVDNGECCEDPHDKVDDDPGVQAV